MPAGGLEWADPTDLDGLREALKLADPEGRLAPIGMSRVEIGRRALDLLPEVVSELASGPRVVLAMDPTPMRRGDDDLKAGVERLLAERFDLGRAIIGEGRAAMHADERALDEAAAALTGADCVVVVGSSTITDLCKGATARVGAPPLVVVQTAASVNAFSDDMAVLLRAGTKRTVPSRWPDALLVEIPVLACALRAMNLAGFGDLISMWTAPADWYLASAVGMDDSYHEAPVALVRLDALFPDDADMEPVVRRAFARIDPSGAVGEECWSDYRVKLALWQRSRPRVEEFLGDWARHRARLEEMVLPPEVLGGALKEAGAPARFGALEPPVPPEIARWALESCHLMRDRFTLADLLFHAGWWDGAFVERLLDRARSAGGGL